MSEFRVKLKTLSKTGSTKEGSKPTLNCSSGISFGKHYTGVIINRSNTDNPVIIAMSFEKHRRKNGVPKHWICHYTNIPISLLQVMNKKVVQGNRTWWLEEL